MSFADHFNFGRPTAAPYVDAAGIVRVAPADTPRFDHGAGGASTGLLVEHGSEMGQGDQVRAVVGDWVGLPTSTVLHEWHDGTDIRAEAHYAIAPLAVVNGCLAAAGHQRRIAVVPGYLRNYGGWVWAIGRRWALRGYLVTDTGKVIATKRGLPLIGS